MTSFKNKCGFALLFCAFSLFLGMTDVAAMDSKDDHLDQKRVPILRSSSSASESGLASENLESSAVISAFTAKWQLDASHEFDAPVKLALRALQHADPEAIMKTSTFLESLDKNARWFFHTMTGLLRLDLAQWGAFESIQKRLFDGIPEFEYDEIIADLKDLSPEEICERAPLINESYREKPSATDSRFDVNQDIDRLGRFTSAAPPPSLRRMTLNTVAKESRHKDKSKRKGKDKHKGKGKNKGKLPSRKPTLSTIPEKSTF